MSGVLIFHIILGVTCGYALWRGGAPERVTAALLLSAALASDYIYSLSDASFQQANLGIAVIDHLLLLGLMLIMWRADRLWPILMTGMHLLNLASYWVKLEDPGIVATIYAILTQSWAYPMQILLAVATLLHQRRLSRYGADNDWLTYSRRSAMRRKASLRG